MSEERCIRREGDSLILPVGGIETVADEMDRLRAEVERLNLTLVALWSYLRLDQGETHRFIGIACGIDACVLCLAEGEVRAALKRSGAFDEPVDPREGAAT